MPQAPTLSIADLNAAPLPAAVAMLEPVIERSPWLAETVLAQRPFADTGALAAVLGATIRGLGATERLRLLRAHPELAPPAPAAMTAASQGEQGRLSLAAPAPAVAQRLAVLNRRYAERFGFPFIIALHAVADTEAVFAQFESRLTHDPATEVERALGEVVSVVTARLARLTGMAHEVMP